MSRSASSRSPSSSSSSSSLDYAGQRQAGLSPRPSRPVPPAKRSRSPFLESYYEDFAREIFRIPVFQSDAVTVNVQPPPQDEIRQVIEEYKEVLENQEMSEAPLASHDSDDDPSYINFNDVVRDLELDFEFERQRTWDPRQRVEEVDPAEVERINRIPDFSERLWELESVLISLGVIPRGLRTHNLVCFPELFDDELEDRCLFALMHVRQYAPPVVHVPVYQTNVVPEMLNNVLNLDNAFERTIRQIHNDVEILMVAAGLITPEQRSNNRINLNNMSDDWIRRLTAHNAAMLRRTFPPRNQ